MNKILYTVFFVLFICLSPLFAQEQHTEDAANKNTAELHGEEKTQEEKRKDIIVYGTEAEVIKLIDTLLKEKNADFSPYLHELISTLQRFYQKQHNSVPRQIWLFEYRFQFLQEPIAQQDLHQ